MSSYSLNILPSNRYSLKPLYYPVDMFVDLWASCSLVRYGYILKGVLSHKTWYYAILLKIMLKNQKACFKHEFSMHAFELIFFFLHKILSNSIIKCIIYTLSHWLSGGNSGGQAGAMAPPSANIPLYVYVSCRNLHYKKIYICNLCIGNLNT